MEKSKTITDRRSNLVLPISISILFTLLFVVPVSAQRIELTASFGAALYYREFGVDTDAYLARADDFLYRAKLVRNCVCSEISEKIG